MYNFRYRAIGLFQNEIFDGLVASVIHIEDNVPVHVGYYTTVRIDPLTRFLFRTRLFIPSLRDDNPPLRIRGAGGVMKRAPSLCHCEEPKATRQSPRPNCKH